jgi:hypothetical protein
MIAKLTPHDQFVLDQWGRQLKEAFGWRAYHVGSSVFPEKSAPPPRDVDVRLMLPDDEFDALIGTNGALRLRALNLSVTLWGRHVTGLPIDFQFQTIDSANEEFARQPRSALGPLSAERSADV